MGFIDERGRLQSEYPADKKILIVGEPHHDIRGQVNLKDFLGEIFQDNPDLKREAVFLAEGTPRGEEISMEDLNQAEPHPNDQLIEQVLESQTITGYTAYEWQTQHGTRIVGTENPKLYEICAKIEAKRANGTSTPRDEDTWLLAVMARNQSMAESVRDKLKHDLDPILFVGDLHMTAEPSEDELTTEKIQQHIASLPPDEAAAFKNIELKSLDTHLKEQGVGYQFLHPKGSDDKSGASAVERANYGNVFSKQAKK